MKSNSKIKFFLLLFLCIISLYAPAQNFQSDCNAATKRHEDTVKVNLLINLYNNYYTQQDDSLQAGLKYILDAYYIAVKLKYKKGIIDASYRLATSVLGYKNMAKATDFYFISLKNSEEAGNKLMEGNALMGLGLVFYNQKKWHEALEYFDKATAVFRENMEEQRLAVVTYLEGLCYNELHDYKMAQGKLEGALSLMQQRGDSARIQECRLGLAKVDYGLMNYDAALEKYELTEKYYEAHKESVALAIIHQGRADVLLAQNHEERALEESFKAYVIAKSSSYNTNLQEITALLYTIYARMGNKAMAYQYLLENSHIKDSLNYLDISEKISIARSNYTFEKKEQKYNEEIDKNNRRKNLAIFSAGFLAVFMLVIIIAYQTLKKERRKSEDLLLNILPKETKDELKKYGKVIPRKHASATIMFCDVQGFTSISSTMSAESLVSMIDSYFSKFDEIITGHGLEKIKTIGDAYMCAGGLHLPYENFTHATKAIDAAIAIMQYATAISQEMIATYGSSFSFRIGIHTGDVVSGIVGSKKYAYDIWGDSVNIAARMEQASEAGHINISGDTFRLVEGQYFIDYRGKINVKNKGEMDMYYILWNL